MIKTRYLMQLWLSILLIVSFQTNAFAASWRVKVIDKNPEIIDRYPHVAITLDRKGFPHMLYGWTTIEYTFLDENGWHTMQIPGIIDAVTNRPEIAVDKNGIAHVVYQDHEQSKLVYGTNINGEWARHTFDFDGFSHVIALDAGNTPHIFATLWSENAGGGDHSPIDG